MSVVSLRYCFFFFFKQKTAYEMRISDWSSDVCSSDLADCHHRHFLRRNRQFRDAPRLHGKRRSADPADGEAAGGQGRAEHHLYLRIPAACRRDGDRDATLVRRADALWPLYALQRDGVQLDPPKAAMDGARGVSDARKGVCRGRS